MRVRSAAADADAGLCVDLARATHSAGEILSRTHADIEDLFSADDYLALSNNGKFDHYRPASQEPDSVASWWVVSSGSEAAAPVAGTGPGVPIEAMTCGRGRDDAARGGLASVCR